MKNLLPISLLVLAMTLPGCAWMKRHEPWHHSSSTATATNTVASSTTTTSKSKPAKVKTPKTQKSQTIVTPDQSLAAKVLTVNTVGRFVVLNFPEGKLPRMDQHLFLYRSGMKSAEVKIVGPQQDTSIVADIVSGDAEVGDTVRDQ